MPRTVASFEMRCAAIVIGEPTEWKERSGRRQPRGGLETVGADTRGSADHQSGGKRAGKVRLMRRNFGVTFQELSGQAGQTYQFPHSIHRSGPTRRGLYGDWHAECSCRNPLTRKESTALRKMNMMVLTAIAVAAVLQGLP